MNNSANILYLSAKKQQSSEVGEDWKYNNVELAVADLATRVTRLEGQEELPVQHSKTEIFGELVGGFSLNAPVTVSLEVYPDETLAIVPSLNIYGEGITELDAIADLKLEIVDLFEDLNSIEDNDLGSELLAHKRTINRIVTKAG